MDNYIQPLPLAQAAVYLGVTESELMRLTELGHLKYQVVDLEWFWTTEVLDAYLLQLKKEDQREEQRRRRRARGE